MSHLVLKKWEQLKKNIELNKNNLTTLSLIKELLNWTKEIQLIKDIQIQNLCDDYYKYFENIDIESIIYIDSNVWYSLDEIIQFDILQAKVESYEWAIIHVRDILFNLLVFKSDKDCPCCSDDNLRVFVEKGSDKLIFQCDICLCMIDENGNKQNIEGSFLVPAPSFLIRLKNIRPSPI